MWCPCRCSQREAEEVVVQPGDGTNGKDSQGPHGSSEPCKGSFHQCHSPGPRQAHVQGECQLLTVSLLSRVSSIGKKGENYSEEFADEPDGLFGYISLQ